MPAGSSSARVDLNGAVLHAPLPEAIRDKFQRQFNALMGAPVNLTYSVVSAIPTLASGKFRYVECRLADRTSSRLPTAMPQEN